jgi:dethiobiotin synthetase
MKSIFVTGTDTGVGKTMISSGIAAYLSMGKGLDVGVMKPFESGIETEEGRDLDDTWILKKASGSRDEVNEINPYLFKAPLAPEAAASLEKAVIDLSHVTSVYKELRARHDVLIVEGAGGLLVPITEGFFYSDLIRAWDTPVIVVSRLTLGTINHTLLTCGHLRSIGAKVLGVILNDMLGENDIASQTNPAMLKKYLDVPLLGVFPHMPDLFEKGVDRERLADLFARHIDCSVFED